VISFSQLKEGAYNYDYEITDEFFDKFEYSEIKKGTLSIGVKLEKLSGILSLEFTIKGSVMTACDICLDEFEIELASKNTLYVKFGDDFREESDEIIFMPMNSQEINIAQYIYEYIHLSLPMKRVHPELGGKSSCNPDMLKRIDELRNKNYVNGSWDVLKNLKNKKEEN